jgi:hypothetical protein
MWDVGYLLKRWGPGWRICSVTPEAYGHQTGVLLARVGCCDFSSGIKAGRGDAEHLKTHNGGAKDDRSDAELLCKLLYCLRDRLRAWNPASFLRTLPGTGRVPDPRPLNRFLRLLKPIAFFR